MKIMGYNRKEYNKNYSKQWRLDNKERKQKSNEEYRKTHKEYFENYRKTHKSTNSPKYTLSAKSRASKKASKEPVVIKAATSFSLI